MKRMLLAAPLIVVVLAGCGGSSGPSDDSKHADVYAEAPVMATAISNLGYAAVSCEASFTACLLAVQENATPAKDAVGEFGARLHAIENDSDPCWKSSARSLIQWVDGFNSTTDALVRDIDAGAYADGWELWRQQINELPDGLKKLQACGPQVTTTP